MCLSPRTYLSVTLSKLTRRIGFTDLQRSVGFRMWSKKVCKQAPLKSLTAVLHLQGLELRRRV